jgi:hypothetical protein
MPIRPDLDQQHCYLDCFDTHLGFLHLRLYPVPELEIPLVFIFALLSHTPLLLAQKLCCGERTFGRQKFWPKRRSFDQQGI